MQIVYQTTIQNIKEWIRSCSDSMENGSNVVSVNVFIKLEVEMRLWVKVE